MSVALEACDHALLELLRHLQGMQYEFVTPTPATHKRVLARRQIQEAQSLVDILGWSMPFQNGVGVGDGAVRKMLTLAGMLEADGNLSQSRVRVSSLHGHLFLHSCYPTDNRDSVFFGPDSYRFANMIIGEFKHRPFAGDAFIVDIGTGAGVGAILAAEICPNATVIMTDINPAALRYARINAKAAGVRPLALQANSLASISRPIDLAMANPPFLIDGAGRAYRDGGGANGAQISIDITRDVLGKLAPAGRFLLYTGSAIAMGEDVLCKALEKLAAAAGCELDYRELDPDIFGEELERAEYGHVDRIALVQAVFRR